MSSRQTQSATVTRVASPDAESYPERNKDLMVPEFLRSRPQAPIVRMTSETEEEELTTLIPAGTFCL